MRTTKRFIVPAALALLLAVGGTACSSGGDDDATDDVATLGASNDNSNSSDDDADDDDGGGGRGGRGVDPEFQDAVLEYAECMRDHGIDMPDPQITEDGGVMISAGAAVQADGGGEGNMAMPSDEEMAAMEEAQEACQPIMEAVRGSLPEPDPEEIAEMQDQALEFAQCMREHGIDFPDPEFSGEGGRMTVAIGGPADGDGPAFDPNDEDFQEASEACGEEGGFGFTGPALSVGGSDGDDG